MRASDPAGDECGAPEAQQGGGIEDARDHRRGSRGAVVIAAAPGARARLVKHQKSAIAQLRLGALRDLLARAETYGSTRKRLASAVADGTDSEAIRLASNEDQWAQGRLEAAAIAYARLAPRVRR